MPEKVEVRCNHNNALYYWSVGFGVFLHSITFQPWYFAVMDAVAWPVLLGYQLAKRFLL